MARVKPDRADITLLSLFVVLAPLWLGPSLPSLSRALGALGHVCACGMPMGTCGCSVCAQLEHQRRAERASLRPILKSTCDDDDAPLPNQVQLACTPGGPMGIREPAVVALLSALPIPERPLFEGEPPPTPPPRSPWL